MKFMRTIPSVLILSLVILAGIPGKAVCAESQTPPEQEAAASADNTTLQMDTVIVNARKRPESSQEVPIAVTTITENEIIDTGLEGMDKIMMMTPGLNGMQSPQSTSSAFNIRGIGTLGGASGFEDGSISAYMDGVPIPIGQLDSYMLDISQIEVLRGPQGTLYGKTAQGGAINIITAAPEDTFNAQVGATVGTLGKQGVEAMVTGPLVKDFINARLFFDTQTRDGDITNTVTDEPLGDVTRTYFRGSFDAKWSARVTSKLNISYDDLDNEDNVFADMEDIDEVNTTEDVYEDRQTLSVGLINKIRLTNNTDLHLVTGANRIDVHTRTLQITGHVPEVEDTETHFNQEIRFNCTSGAFEWTAGLFGSYFKRDIHHSLDSTDTMGQPYVFDDKGEQTATTTAIFGEGTYALTKTVKITGGLRLNRDERTVDETVVNQGMYPYYQAFTHRMKEEKTYDNWSGRTMVAYTPTDDHTVFGSISRGYKPGGYQMYHNTAMTTGALDTPDFDESTSLSYEIGYKGLFLDRRISFDTAVFYTTTEGEHILGINPTTYQSIFYNVDSESYGLEMSAKARAAKHLTLGGSLALTRAYVTEDLVLYPEVAGVMDETVIQDGDELPNVPDSALYLFTMFRKPLSVFGKECSGFVRADYAWKSKIWFDATHGVENDAYGVVNMRIGLENEKVSLLAYADNLMDEDYLVYGLGASGIGMVRPSRDREVGVKFKMFF